MAKEKKEENALVVYGKTELAKYMFTDKEALSLITENLAGESLTQADLERIKFPTGGMTVFSRVNLQGEEYNPKTIEGIVIGQRLVRAYWESEFNGEGVPPDCFSEDRICSMNGAICSECPYSQWKSALKNGQPAAGQACKMITQLFMLEEDNPLPIYINIPPTSIKIARKYFLGLAVQKHRIYDVVTSLSLLKTKSKGGIDYALLKAASVGVVEKQYATQIESFTKIFSEVMKRAVVVNDDATTFDDND
jgi:hypothetical protein